MFNSLFTRLKEELSFQRDLAAMEAMDDRELADIGVTRFELPTAMRSGRHDLDEADVTVSPTHSRPARDDHGQVRRAA